MASAAGRPAGPGDETALPLAGEAGLPVTPPGEQSSQHVDDLLLPGGALVELGAHLGETPACLLEPSGCLHAERVDRGAVGVDLDSEIGEITIARSGQVPGGCGVSANLLHAGFQRVGPGLEVGHFGHGQSPLARAEPPPLGRPGQPSPHTVMRGSARPVRYEISVRWARVLLATTEHAPKRGKPVRIRR